MKTELLKDQLMSKIAVILNKPDSLASEWIAVDKAISSAFKQVVKEELTSFIDFLLREGYCDTDVYAEPPTAIDRYLFPELRDK